MHLSTLTPKVWPGLKNQGELEKDMNVYIQIHFMNSAVIEPKYHVRSLANANVPLTEYCSGEVRFRPLRSLLTFVATRIVT